VSTTADRLVLGQFDLSESMIFLCNLIFWCSFELSGAINAEGVRQLQPRVASTLGKEERRCTTLKELARSRVAFANAFSVRLS